MPDEAYVIVIRALLPSPRARTRKLMQVDTHYELVLMIGSRAIRSADRTQTHIHNTRLDQWSITVRKTPVWIAVPPDHEQRAIAEALSDVDGLLAALEALIAKKRAVKQAAMQQLLTGKSRLPGFSGVWETKRLGEVADLKNGYHLRAALMYQGTMYQIITIANVRWLPK